MCQERPLARSSVAGQHLWPRRENGDDLASSPVAKDHHRRSDASTVRAARDPYVAAWWQRRFILDAVLLTGQEVAARRRHVARRPAPPIATDMRQPQGPCWRQPLPEGGLRAGTPCFGRLTRRRRWVGWRQTVPGKGGRACASRPERADQAGRTGRLSRMMSGSMAVPPRRATVSVPCGTSLNRPRRSISSPRTSTARGGFRRRDLALRR